MAIFGAQGGSDIVREFAIVEKPGYHVWCADDVRAEINRRMLYEKLTPREVEDLADKMGCRIVWAGPDGKVRVF